MAVAAAAAAAIARKKRNRAVKSPSSWRFARRLLADAAPARRMRRIHLRVGPDAFLPAQLALADDGGWFGAAELDELLALLHDELPRRLPEALRAQAPTPPVVCRGDTVQACLTFLPTDGGGIQDTAADARRRRPRDGLLVSRHDHPHARA